MGINDKPIHSGYVEGQIEPLGQFCFNPGQFRALVRNTSHRSPFYQHRKQPKQSLNLTLGLRGPKQKFLGLMLALVNGYGCL